MRLAASSHIHLAVPVLQHIDCKMRRSAKAEESNAVPALHARNTKTAKSDNARAQQRSQHLCRSLLWQRNAEVGPCNRVLRISAIDRIARERRMVAKIFMPFQAQQASAVDA